MFLSKVRQKKDIKDLLLSPNGAEVPNGTAPNFDIYY